MTTFQVSAVIDRPVAVVANALTRAENFPYWQTDLEKLEVVRGGPDEVGSISHLHYRQNGRPYIMEDRLVYCEPGKRYISVVSGDAVAARVDTVIEPLGDSTRVTLTWRGRAKILRLRILFPFLKGKMARQAQDELDTFKHLVETRGADFSVEGAAQTSTC